MSGPDNVFVPSEGLTNGEKKRKGNSTQSLTYAIEYINAFGICVMTSIGVVVISLRRSIDLSSFSEIRIWLKAIVLSSHPVVLIISEK